MSFLQTFQVFPNVPESLKFLEVLARNMWWCWNLGAVDLFRRIDPKLWGASGRNPIVFSTMIDQKRMTELAEDESFLAHLRRIEKQFQKALMAPEEETSADTENAIAYFSMEFGIHESLPQFAGGLGILAGDHMKAASDLKLPIVGVGLFYRNGYFHQYLNHEGWQQESYPEIDLYNLPISRALDPSGNELRISVTGPDGVIRLVVWKLKVGRITIYLLDTNVKENTQEVRDINSNLYKADNNVRLAQEVILGIGGMRALDAMGISPVVCHMNEGHCSFSSIERLAKIMKRHKVDLQTAKEICARTTIFTTHTPVAAGHDEFEPDAVKPYLAPFEKPLGLTCDELLSWGQGKEDGPEAPFSMSVLGLRLAQYCNGVSELHGEVARKMWAYVWPDRPEEEIPIHHVTNGVHIPSWISIENALLFDRYLEPEWHLNAWKNKLGKRIDDIYDDELWRAHGMSRTRLIRSCREILAEQYGRRNAPETVMKEVESVLGQDVLTIALARRFATYKRATLMLRDMDRFKALLLSEERPVQFIIAGKAHPDDNEGKTLLQQIAQLSLNPEFRHKVVFLEDYDINVARRLIQGADVWLNTPRRPYEACGTSGMKAAANGVINVSVLDGWWCEGYSPETGWAIGNGEEYDDRHYQDDVESQALYNILENHVIPCFYDRESGGVPVRWLQMMKASMRIAIEQFCAHNMVDTYHRKFYTPAVKRFYELTADDSAKARQLTLFRERLRECGALLRPC